MWYLGRMRRLAIRLAIIAVLISGPAFLFVVAYGLSQIFQDFGMVPFLLFCLATAGAALSVAHLFDTSQDRHRLQQDDR